jgi:hypothetical protein
VLQLIERAVQHDCRDHYDPSQRAAVFTSYAQTLFVDALGPAETIVAEREGTSYMSRAIAIWTQADDLLSELKTAGPAYRAAVLTDDEAAATASPTACWRC